MNNTSHPYAIILDLEATCCEKRSVPRNQLEIIEIGAVAFDNRNLEIVYEFSSFVRPVRHPELTPFCTELTTITQEDVEAAPSYPELNASFAEWLKGFETYEYCSWGDYDRNQFEQDCRYHGLASPFSEAHRNIKKDFSVHFGSKRRFGLGGAIRALGMEFEGTAHRGIDDAYNIARIYRHFSIRK